jgi:anti-sigma regulatory factor (Ser/Thr protein kinase)
MSAPRYGAKSMTVSVAAGPGAVAEALSAASRFADAAAIGRDATEKLAIIVEELVLNIVDHGEAPTGSAIELTLTRGHDTVRLAVSDAGAAFDPRSMRVAEIPERGGGAGLALVRAWSLVERYERRRGRNRLELALPLAGVGVRPEPQD